MAENAVQVSFKADNGLIFVVGGKDYAEYVSNLTAVLDDPEAVKGFENDMANLLTSSGEFASAVKNVHAASGGGNSHPDSPPATEASAPTCVHGTRVWKSGEKNGKKWKAWFCPSTDRNNQCAAQWVN